jgi:hypothetical protein
MNWIHLVLISYSISYCISDHWSQFCSYRSGSFPIQCLAASLSVQYHSLEFGFDIDLDYEHHIFRVSVFLYAILNQLQREHVPCIQNRFFGSDDMLI